MASAVPPKLKNGSEMPVFGTRFVTTAMFKKTCKAICVVMPTTRRLPKRSRAWSAIQ